MDGKELISILNLKNWVGKLFVILLNLVFIHIFFSTRGLYNSNYYLYIDHGGFNSLVWGLGEFIIPQFGSSYGYSSLIHCGYPLLPFFPLGFFYLVVFVAYLGFGYAVSYKIILALIMLLWGILPYKIVKVAKGSEIAAFISVLWFWIGMQFFWLSRTSTGAMESLLGSYLAFYFLYYTSKLDFHELKHIFMNYKHILLTFLLFFIAFVNFTYCIFIAIFIIEDLVIKFFRAKKIDQEIKNEILFFIEMSLFGILLYSFWLIPTLLIHFPYITFNKTNFLYQLEYSLHFNIEYIKRNFVGMIFIIIALIYTRIEKKDLPISQFFKRLLVTSFLIVFIVPFLNIPFLNGVNSYRYIFFFEISGVFFVGSTFTHLIFDIKRIIRKRKIHDLIGNNSERYQLKCIFLILFFLLAFIDLLPIRPDLYTFRSSLYNSPNTSLSEWDPEDIEMMNWIKANTTKASRILFQNSGDHSNYGLSGGHNNILLAINTDRYYATGFTVELFWNYSVVTNFIDDVLYGKDLINYTKEELQFYFDNYNIEFIVVWSDLAKDFFNNISSNSDVISNIYSTEKYSFFQYNYAKKNFVIASDEIIIDDLSISEPLISFTAQNISNNRIFTYSLHDYPNWNVIINGKMVEKIYHPLGLISFIIPEDVSDLAYIEIKWMKTNVEKISEAVSLISAFILIINPVMMKIYYQKKKISLSSIPK